MFKQMQYVCLKSGLIIRFDTNKFPFTFNENGYFVGDVGLHNPQLQTDKHSNLMFRNVESFTFKNFEISAHWSE